MSPSTARTTHVGSLPRCSANTALLQLTESTQKFRCLPETARSRSVWKWQFHHSTYRLL